MDGTKVRPFADVESLSKIDAYPWPDVDVWDFEAVSRAIEGRQDRFAIMLGGWNPVFCTVLDFFGVEHGLIAMHTDQKLIESTITHILEYYLEFYRRLFEASRGKAHIFNMGDDFATQRGLLISPELWRRLLLPAYIRIFSLAKKYGLYMWFHSCGTFGEILPDLIDAGMDVWETVQAHLLGNEPESLKKKFGKNISFFGAINTQQTLPYGTPDQVRQEVRERIAVLGKGGGYICGPAHHINPDVPIENTIALFDEIGKYRDNGCTL